MPTRDKLVEDLAHAEAMLVRWDRRLRRGVNARAKWARKAKRLHLRLGSMEVAARTAPAYVVQGTGVKAKRRGKPSRKLAFRKGAR